MRPRPDGLGRALALALALAFVLPGCAVGPDYHKPETVSPAAFKEAPVDPSEWRVAAPDDHLPRGAWWALFGDPGLSALEEEVASANTTIAQAEARYRAARAVVRQSRADFYPTVTAGAGVTRARVHTSVPGEAPVVATATTYSATGDASWELDLWGRVRRNVESSVAGAEAAGADLENVRLSMQAELAVDWYQLHGFDAQIALLAENAEAQERALKVTRNRHDQGVVSGVDVAQAETLLEATRAQVIEARLSRAQTEHAIAFLVGKAPADLTIPPAKIAVGPPAVPGLLPSELLERRPDVASAERQVAAANALVGVATAAYFPTVSIDASAGFVATTLSKLFSAPSFVWSVGPAALATLFDAGRRRAVTDERRAEYDAAVAAYRETALRAFQEVEDQLAAVRLLADEEKQQAAVVAAAEKAFRLAENRYEGGITTYLEVVTAQTVALSNERAAVDILTRRMVASVNLVKALGGGFEANLAFSNPS
ncbi:MAG TPA: efflux transporter outer membrane subunit [Thermoanaerobaculia bacterium]|nr:efflux transporter outer membrane subunit [Thermoanaerobaculia bacterium]